jgi:hypothetical protein
MFYNRILKFMEFTLIVKLIFKLQFYDHKIKKVHLYKQ